MKNKLLVVGLGNDSNYYQTTRHNAGRLFTESCVQTLNLNIQKIQHAYWAPPNSQENIIGFLWLKTLMNDSGKALQKAIQEIAWIPDQIIICFDNVDSSLGTVKFFSQLGPKNHNGLKNIRDTFPKQQIWGLGFGVDRKKPLSDWVLRQMTPDESKKLQTVFNETTPKLIKGWKEAQHLPTTKLKEKIMVEQLSDLAMPAQWLTVTGGQFGDEGKGKIVDFLAQQKQYQTICRFSGGPNAGHTVHVDHQKFTFSMLPVGVLHPQKTVILGSGCLINLTILNSEKLQIKKLGFGCDLLISPKAHVIMPYHLAWDHHEENNKKVKIGTTRQGIGPCMADKVNRIGILIGDLLHPEQFHTKLATIVAQKNQIWTKVFNYSPFDVSKIAQEILDAFQPFKKCVVDLQPWGQKLLHKSVLFEGAQGTLLDIHFGHYPFVTSTPTTAMAAQLGLEHAGTATNWHHLGVFKAYVSRVGTGPLLGKMTGEEQTLISKLGHETGTVTHRPRQLAWFDAPSARYAIAVNRYDSLALTCLDALTGMKEIKIIEAYEIDQQLHYTLPFTQSLNDQTKCKMISLPGWNEPIGEIRNFDDLPINAQKYVHQLEAILGHKIRYLSVGPQRSQMITR